jgi:hypothetical protein
MEMVKYPFLSSIKEISKFSIPYLRIAAYNGLFSSFFLKASSQCSLNRFSIENSVFPI